MYKHFLLMRYNTGLYSTRPYGNKVKDPDTWMRKRLPMFERFLCSLEKQTEGNFTLVIGVDALTPKLFLIQIKEVASEILSKERKISAVMVEGAPADYVREIHIKEPWLITSRIDNDDEYLPKFIETIHREFSEKEEILDVKGMQSDGKVFYDSGRPGPNSPFLSVVERAHTKYTRKTAHYIAHSNMGRVFPARFANDEYLYIQHIHDHNLMNKIIGKQLSY